MEDKENNISITNKLSQKITSLSLDKEELKKLCDILQERANAAADIEVDNYKRGENQDDASFENDKKLMKEAFVLNITIKGANGSELYGPIEEVFNSPNFPENIIDFYVNSETLLKALYNWYPRNSFDLLLDFSKPNIFDFSFMPNQSTPNDSILRVQGYDATWPNGVFHEIINFIKERTSPLSWIHKHSIYDILLCLLSIPLAFWACYKGATFFESLNINIFLKNSIYVYTFFVSLWIFKILFHYLRWVVPLVEYRNKRNKIITHRFIFSALLLGILCSFIYDVIKLILNI